jgi:hypothetical protein
MLLRPQHARPLLRFENAGNPHGMGIVAVLRFERGVQGLNPQRFRGRKLHQASCAEIFSAGSSRRARAREPLRGGYIVLDKKHL